MRIFLTLLIGFCIVAFPVEIQSFPEVSAKSAVLIDAETGRVIYEKNSRERLSMASTTKIITAITAIENGNLSDVVTISANAVNTEGSSVWLHDGERLTLSELLYALLLESGNDASVAIAEHIGGSVENFSVLMNETCKKAGATDTNCVTPSGLDDKYHYTTASDMAKIARYAMDSAIFREIVSTYKTAIPMDGVADGRTLVNHNKLLALYDGVTGIKTGFTKKSGRCLVSSTTKNGWSLIAVTLNAPDDWNDHIRMLDYAYNTFNEEEVLCYKNSSLGHLEIPGVATRIMEYAPKETVKIKKLDKIADVQFFLDIPDKPDLPLKKGEEIGTADIYIDNLYYKTIPLISIDAVEKNDIMYLLKDKFRYLLKILLELVR